MQGLQGAVLQKRQHEETPQGGWVMPEGPAGNHCNEQGGRRAAQRGGAAGELDIVGVYLGVLGSGDQQDSRADKKREDDRQNVRQNLGTCQTRERGRSRTKTQLREVRLLSHSTIWPQDAR